MSLLTGEFALAFAEIEAEYADPSEAIKFLESLIAFYHKLPQDEVILRKLAFASDFLGDADMRANNYQDALAAFKEAQQIAEKYHAPEVMWVYSRIGYTYEREGNLQSALSYDQRAAEVMERFGISQQLVELQLSSKELAWGLYENLTRVTLELYAKNPSDELLDQAFAYHEEGKARAFLDLLDNADVRAREGIDPELVLEEDEVRAKVSALESAFSDTRVSELEKISLEQALDAQSAELGKVHQKMAAANAKYQSIASPTKIRIADVQRLLDKDTVLLEYDLGPEFSGVGHSH